MRNKKTVINISKKVLYIILIVITYIFQFLFLPRFGINFPILLIIPVIISIAMYEREFSGMFFGLLAGALWDLASPLPDGLLALYFTFFACATGLLTHYLLRNTLLTALLLSFSCIIFYSLAAQLFLFTDFSYEIFRELVITHYLPSILISVVITVPDYFIIRAISKYLQTEKI